MAASDFTPNYEFGIYKPQDKTSWLTDFNGNWTKADKIIKQIADQGGSGGSVVLLDSTGQSTTAGMTQKAITDALADSGSVPVLPDKIVQIDTNISNDKSSTVTLIKSRGSLNSEETNETELPLPVASESQAGVVNPSTYQTIQTNAENIDAILNGSVAISDLEADPSQESLTEKWKTATGKNSIISGAKILDVSNNKTWTYYSNSNTWYEQPNTGDIIEINNFTNESAGLIQGADVDGKVYAEADGTGSVKGWDNLKSKVNNNSTQISDLKSVLPNMYMTSVDTTNTKASASGFKAQFIVQSNTGGTGVMSFTIPVVEGNNAGLMTVSDKNRLNQVVSDLGDVENLLARIADGAGV